MTYQHKPFRFGLLSHNTSPSLEHLVAQARQAEQAGYAIFLLPDHLEDQFAPALALAMVAQATTSIHIGSCVFDNDFRHPAMLAKDVATLDHLSHGRFELGLGAGWMQSEYEHIGLSFDRPAVRIARLAEAIQIVKALLTEETVSFSGQHYSINSMHSLPRPLQTPFPPIYLGGSGKRMLQLAAREASCVGIVPRIKKAERGEYMNDLLDMDDAVPDALQQKISWIREAAGPRSTDLELNIVLMEVQVTDAREQAQQTLADRYGASAQAIQDSPFFLVGSHEQIREKLWQVREQLGFSYITAWEEHLEALAPVVAHLTGR